MAGILSLLSCLQNLTTPEPLMVGTTMRNSPNVVVTQELFGIYQGLDTPYSIVSKEMVMSSKMSAIYITDKKTRYQFGVLSRQAGWFARAPHIIIGNSPNINLFRDLWKRGVPNALYADGLGKCYIYNPFNLSMYPVPDGEVISALRHRWRDMNGYKIRVSTYPYTSSGPDRIAMRELMTYRNMTPVLMMTNRKGSVSAERISRSEVGKGNADIGMIEGFTKLEYLKKLEFSKGVVSDCIVIVLRKPPLLRGWDIFIRSMKWQVWVAIIITLGIGNRFLMFVKGVKDPSLTIATLARCMFAIPLIQISTRTPERLILGTAMLFGTTVVPIYEASIYKFTRNRIRQKQFATIAELNAFNVPVVTRRLAYKEIMELRQSREISELVRRTRHTSNITMDTFEEGTAVVMSKRDISVLATQGMAENKFYVLREAIQCNMMAFPVTKGSPYLWMISDFATKCFESGLASNWNSKEMEVLNGKHNKRHRAKVLTMREIEVGMFVIGAGLLLSTIVFILEVIVKYCKHCRLCKYIKNCIKPRTTANK